MNKLKLISNILCISIIAFTGFANASPQNPEANFDYRIINNKTTALLTGNNTNNTNNAKQTNTKIEVVEFFSYGCGHCYAFDPTLKEWSAKNKQNIILKRIPVGFSKTYEKYQKLFYSLEAMGKEEQVHEKVFNTIHKENNPLQTDADITKFAIKNNIDTKQLLAIYNSFSIATKIKQATKIADEYQVDGVPMVLVGGKYITSPSMVSGREEVLKVMDFLVNLSKKN